MKKMYSRLKLKKTKDEKYILQTISDNELNLALTHTKQRIYLAVWEYSRSSRLEVFLGKGVLKYATNS